MLRSFGIGHFDCRLRRCRGGGNRVCDGHLPARHTSRSDTSERPFENLVSGTALEVLERTSNYARVRTPDGQEGWVKSDYLVDVQAGHAACRGARSRARAACAATSNRHRARVRAPKTSCNRLGKQVAATSGSADAVQETLARLKHENESYEDRLESYRRQPAVALGCRGPRRIAGGRFRRRAMVARRADTSAPWRFSHLLTARVYVECRASGVAARRAAPQQERVQERIGHVGLGLHLPPVVDQAERRDQIDEPVQPGPIAPEAPLHRLRGRDSERDQAASSAVKPTVMYGRSAMSASSVSQAKPRSSSEYVKKCSTR